MILGTGADAAPPERWASCQFVLQVASVRRHLAPISEPGLLVSSFGREAFHGPDLGPVPAITASPVRVAYAICWVELQTGLHLPEWSLWFDRCASDP